jgi:hypothetical protein
MYRDYTSVITPTVDLMAHTTPAVYLHEGPPVTATIRAVVSNNGNVSTTSSATVTFFDGPPGETGTNQIGTASVISDGLSGCSDLKIVEAEWPGLQPGVFHFYVEVTATNDDRVDNNVAEGVVLVASHRQFWPQVSKAR